MQEKGKEGCIKCPFPTLAINFFFFSLFFYLSPNTRDEPVLERGRGGGEGGDLQGKGKEGCVQPPHLLHVCVASLSHIPLFTADGM